MSLRLESFSTELTSIVQFGCSSMAGMFSVAAKAAADQNAVDIPRNFLMTSQMLAEILKSATRFECQQTPQSSNIRRHTGVACARSDLFAC